MLEYQSFRNTSLSGIHIIVFCLFVVVVSFISDYMYIYKYRINIFWDFYVDRFDTKIDSLRRSGFEWSFISMHYTMYYFKCMF